MYDKAEYYEQAEAAPEQPGEVSRLHEVAQALHSAINELERRLGPVIVGEGPEAVPHEKPAFETALAEAVESVETSERRLRSMTKRVRA